MLDRLLENFRAAWSPSHAVRGEGTCLAPKAPNHS